jgi:hypothetical protein
MSDVSWSDYDEGYVRAEEWSRALAGGTELPVDEVELPLDPGELAHARLSPFTLAAYISAGFTYQPMFGIFVTGEVALGRRASWRADTQNASAPRWHRLRVVELVVTNRRLIASTGDTQGSVALEEAGPLQLVPGIDGGPAVQFQPAAHPALQLGSPWAPVLYVFARTLVDGRPPQVPMPAAVLDRARTQGRLTS